MDTCRELEADIDKIKNDIAVFEGSLDDNVERVRAGMADIEKTIDAMLDKHKKQFMEKNPELFAGHIIEEFDPDMPGVTKLPNGDLFIHLSVADRVEYLVKVDKTDEGFVYNENFFNQEGVSNVVFCLPNDGGYMAIGQDMKAFREITIGENGDFTIGESVAMIDGEPKDVAILSSGEFVVFEADGQISIVRKVDNGGLAVERGKFNFGSEIGSASRIDNDNYVLIGEDGRTVKVCHFGEKSDDVTIQEVPLPEGSRDFSWACAFGDDGGVFLMGEGKPTRLRKNESGEYYLGEDIDVPLDASMVPLPNGDIMAISGNSVELVREDEDGEVTIKPVLAHSYVGRFVYGTCVMANGDIAIECMDGLRFLRKDENGVYTISTTIHGKNGISCARLTNGRIASIDTDNKIKMLSEERTTSLGEVKQKLPEIIAKAYES